MTTAAAQRARGGYEVGLMREEDEPGVRELLRTPMDGAIALSLEREPDSRLGQAIQGDRHRVVVVRERNSRRIVATGSRSARLVHLGGERRYLGYLGELRRAPEATLAARRLLREAFELLEEHRRPDELPFDLTSIMADNAPARRLLERNLPGLPRYRPYAELVTYVIETGGRGATLRSAAAGDIPAIADCLQRNLAEHPLSPVWSARDLASRARCRGLAPADVSILWEGDRVRACSALWDQRAFKQSVVRGYRGALGRARPYLNAVRALTNKPRLPQPGAPLSMAYLSHVAVDGRDAETFLDLVGSARRRAKARGINWLVTAFVRGHPFGRALERTLRPRRYSSILYLVSRADAPRDLTALYADIPHVEVATL